MIDMNVWLRDFAEIAESTPVLEDLQGSDYRLWLVAEKFRAHYALHIPNLAKEFPGWTTALREGVCDEIRKICQLVRDEERGRKIVIHPLLAISMEDQAVRLKPVTFSPAKMTTHVLQFNGKMQWWLSTSLGDTKYNFIICPHPGCLIGSYTYPDTIQKHV